MENTKELIDRNEVDSYSGRIETLNDSVYEIFSEDDIALYVAGILDIGDAAFDKGIDFLREDRSFAILYDILVKLFRYVKSRNLSGFTFMLENNYVDRVYRDSYYIYFSGKHFWHNRFCKRIFLFANIFDEPLLDLDIDDFNKYFVGTVVITPIPGQSVGRTLINPKYLMDNNSCYIRMAQYNMTAYGKRLLTEAFPYSMQDGETTTCAEITILNLMDYYSRSYPEYHYLLPSDINKAAREKGYERVLPTHGLHYEMISKVFYENGFYPRMCFADKMPKEKFRRILYYYIESGIPLSLGVATTGQNKHSIIVIGHGELNLDNPDFQKNVYNCYDKKSGNLIWVHDAANISKKFCVMDDNRVPYALMDCNINEAGQLLLGDYVIETMMVPLYKKMYLEATDASEIFKVIFASKEYGIKDSDFTFLRQIMGESVKSSLAEMKDNPLTIRIFMTSSRSFRKVRESQFAGQDTEARLWYSTTVFPRFIWVCEISLIEFHTKSVFGELVLDATSSADAYADSLIIAHYPGRILCRLPNDIQDNMEDEEYEFHEIRNWNTFLPYDSNLSLVMGDDG